MALKSREELKTFFSEGKKPNEEQFFDLIDSLTHKNEIIQTETDFATLLEAREGTVADKAMSPFLVLEAIKVLVILANVPTLKTEIEGIIANEISNLRGGVSGSYDTLSEIVSLVDTKATPANITTAINGLKGAVSAEYDSLEKIQGFIVTIFSVLDSDTDTLNSLQELVDYAKANKADITSILSDKLSISNLINDFNSTSTTTAPTADTVRRLKDMIDALNNLSLGETSNTAYRGDRGKVAYDHSQSSHAPSDAQKNSDITKGEIEAVLTGEIDTHTHATLGLGETSNTAYRGDRGKSAYDHSQASHAPSDAQKNSDITKGEIEAVLTGEIDTHTHDIESEVISIIEKKHDLGYAYNLSTGTISYNSIILNWDAVIFGDGLFKQGLKWQLFYDTSYKFVNDTKIEIDDIDLRTATISGLSELTQYYFELRPIKPNEIIGEGAKYRASTIQAVANVPVYSTHNSNWEPNA